MRKCGKEIEEFEEQKNPKKNISQTGGLSGFKCPKSQRDVKFDFCWNTCKEKCKPAPALFSVASSRNVEENVYHVTEILNPPRIVYYTRNYPYFGRIDNLIVMKFGTAVHQLLENTKEYVKELELEDDYLIEQNFLEPIPTGAIQIPRLFTFLSGTSDLYVKSTKTLWDFKTMKYYYAIKYLIEKQNWDDGKYHWQLNIYRRFQYPECEMLKIFAFVKDWNRTMKRKYDIDPTETLQVPMISDKIVDATVKKLLTDHVQCQADPTKIRDCTEKEMWHERIRCHEYCAISDLCPQFQKFLKEIK